MAKPIPEYVYFCFDVIISHLKGIHNIPVPTCIPTDKFPLFVTWKIGKEKDLRGCIGTFDRELSLRKGLKDYAMSSAFRDSRFNPITIKEIPDLHCSVSILTNFEWANNCYDWDIGTHGIRIEFVPPKSKREYSGVFLPEVMIEQEWDKETTLRYLVKKAGYNGPFNDDLCNTIKLERFQSQKVSRSYDDYIKYKNSSCQ
ncbi:AMMECR1 domain and AMMECR1 family and AMMECR1, N-terminal domain-containing protein [Strongyloides ratti]|uniref:AMMECR1 domain and AMMECR1 family and AMMECR1, N-terminal domain-containing protein n=1 Tax=Strongyloides ratti TaxID=34506 RepID=A0A090L3N2_STRRB|nr:AMMECR1 domain and AMMECR1 family and AMMECR1, N-terminal domain-containing protein [Strongyloides ratti]CEF62094.1 AMMECR1 domain and AMMECR1 family and AMMECR1, N-terminal domain-containing protein [Strongyloides ratti]